MGHAVGFTGIYMWFWNVRCSGASTLVEEEDPDGDFLMVME